MNQKEFEALMARRKTIKPQSIGNKVMSSDDSVPVDSTEGLGSKALRVGSAIVRAPLQIKELAKGVARAPVSIAQTPFEGLDLGSRISKAGAEQYSRLTTDKMGLTSPEARAEIESTADKFGPVRAAKFALKVGDNIKEHGLLKPSDRVTQGWETGIYDPEWWAGNVGEAAAYSGFFMRSAKKHVEKTMKKQMAVLANKKASKSARTKAQKEIAKSAAKNTMAKAGTVEGMMSHGEYRKWEEKNPEDATIVGDLVSTMFGATAGSIEGLTSSSLIMRPFIKKLGMESGTKAAKGFIIELAKAAPLNVLKEGGTEALQQVVGNIGKKLGYEPDQDIFEGVMDSMIIGGAVGGGFSVYEAKPVSKSVPQSEKDYNALKKSEKKVKKLKLKIEEATERYNNTEEGTLAREKAERDLQYHDSHLQKQEVIADEMISRIKGEVDPITGEAIKPELQDESANVLVSDEEAFGNTVDPSLTIDEVATGVDEGTITKDMWDNTNKGTFTDEAIVVVEEHLRDKQDIDDIEKMAAGVGFTNIDNKGVKLDQEEVDSIDKSMWQQLPDEYTDEDAINALNADLMTNAENTKSEAPKITLSKSTGKNNEVVSQLTDILGIRAVRVNISDTDVGTFNGVISNTDDKLVYINSKSDRPEMWIMGHEFSHSLKRSNPDAYSVLLEVAAQEIDPKELSKYRKQQDKALGAKPGTISSPAAVEEMLGDFVGDRFSDQRFWSSIYEKNPSKFKDIIESVKSYIRNIMVNFTGEGKKADKFFSDMVKLDKTLTDTINKHVGYTGAAVQLQQGEVNTGEVKDLNINNKHNTSIQLGDTGTMMINEDEDIITLHRFSRAGSQRGNDIKNLVETNEDKGTPTAALNELKAYANINGKKIIAETRGHNKYMANQNFKSVGTNMEWVPNNDIERVEADKIKAAEDTVSRELETVTETLERTDIADEERATAEDKLGSLLVEKRKVGGAVGPVNLKDATSDPGEALRRAKEEEFELTESLENAKNEESKFIESVQNNKDIIYSTTSRDDLLIAKDDIAISMDTISVIGNDITGYNKRAKELTEIIKVANNEIEKEKVGDKKDKKQVRGDGQQGRKGVRDPQYTPKGKKTDGSNRDIKVEKKDKVKTDTITMYHGGSEYNGGPRWLSPDIEYAKGYAKKSGSKIYSVKIPSDNKLLKKAFDDSGTSMTSPFEAFEAPEGLLKGRLQEVGVKRDKRTLTEKIVEVKKEEGYKRQGVEGQLNRIANKLSMDGMHGDIPAFMTHVQKEGIDPKDPLNAIAFQDALSNFVRAEESDASPIKKKKPKAKAKKGPIRTTKERVELGVLSAMMQDQMSGSMPKSGTKEYSERVSEITEDIKLRVEQENEENNIAGTKIRIKAEEKSAMLQGDDSSSMKFSVDPKSSIPGVDERTEKAKTLATRSLYRVLKDTATASYKSFTSPVSELVPGKYGYAKDRIRLAKEVDKFGSREAFRRIYQVINKLGSDEQHVFTMNLILSDMIFDTIPNENGVALLKEGQLPFGYKTIANVRTDLRHYREQAKKSPRTMIALARRRKMMGALRDKLIKRGFIPKELSNNDAYFHHLTLEKLSTGDDYMFGIYKRAGDKDVSWAHERGGTIKSYSTDYIVSEFSVISNAIATMELSRIKDQLRAKYDITSDLKKKANGKIIVPPKGYTTFLPSQRLGWGASPSFPDAVSDNVLQQAKIDPEIKRQMQIASGNQEMWIIPEKLASGLSRIRETHHETMPEKMSNSVIQAWKKWVLINPLRVVGYNIRNMAGDVDIAMAYDWNIMRYTKQAMADIAGDIEATGTSLPFNMQRFGTKLSTTIKTELKEAHRLGVIGAGFVMHEITDIAGEFETLMKGPQGNPATKFGMNWWQASKDATNYRENILRLASYRYFKDRLAKGETNIYGASNPAEIDEITNVNEKAAKLSRELIGDYGRLSESGEWMRKHLIPFYSWMEINAPRYVRMMKNIKNEGGLDKKGIDSKQAIGMAWKGGVLAAKFYMFTAMISMWNMTMFGDDEDDLKGYQKKNMHLLLGRRSDGSIRYLPLQGAFRDALSWFGGENTFYDIGDYLNGDITPMDAVVKTATAGPLKLYTGSRPFFRAGTELLYGSTLFPDPSNPRPISDKWEYVSKVFSADIIYRMAKGKSTRGFAEEIRNKLFYNVSTGESAYYSIRDKVNKYNKKVEYNRPTVIMSKDDTIGKRRAYALRNYKQALKFVDVVATEKFLRMYLDAGGTRSGLTSSFKLSKPTGGLRKKDRSGFYKTLSKKDTELLNTASKWYRNTYQNFGKRP